MGLRGHAGEGPTYIEALCMIHMIQMSVGLDLSGSLYQKPLTKFVWEFEININEHISAQNIRTVALVMALILH